MFKNFHNWFFPESVFEAFEEFLAEHLPNDDLPKRISDRLSDLDIPIFQGEGVQEVNFVLPEQTDGLGFSFNVPRSEVAFRTAPAAGSGLDIAAAKNAEAMPLSTAPQLPTGPMTLPAEIAKGIPDFLGRDFGASGSSGLASEVGLGPGSQGAGTGDGRVQVMIELASGIGPGDIEGLITGFGGEVSGTVRFGGALGGDAGAILTITLPSETVFDTLKEALERSPMIEAVELDRVRGLAAESNDPFYTDGSLWGMYGPSDDGIGSYGNANGSGADVAWSTGLTGTSTTVVGVNDSGIDPTHPDLYLNIWINQDEIPDDVYNGLVDVDSNRVITFHDLNHVDNAGSVSDSNNNGFIDAIDILADASWADDYDRDANGFIDDLFGWNWIDDNNRPFVLSTSDDQIGFGPFVQDTGSHGVHVSGTIGAMGGNNEGVAGVNWDTQIIAMKTFYQGAGTVSDITAANNYFADLAFSAAASSRSAAYDFVATNNSYVDTVSSSLELQSIVDLAALDILFVAAAGNSGENLDGSGEAYPAEYNTFGLWASDNTFVNFDNVIAVAAIDSNGNLAGFSSYGATSVDIAAPGAGIWSTIAGGGYGSKDGTSMAAPHVTGAVVLYASANPDASAADIKAALLGTAVVDSSLGSFVLDGKVLSIDQLLGTNPNIAPVAADDLISTDEDTAVVINVVANDTDVDGDTLTIGSVGTPSNGTVSDNLNGTITYTPNANFNGSDTFTYTISDGKGGSDTATVTVTVNSVNDAPDASDDNATTIQDTAVTVSVLSNDTDVDSDTLTIGSVGTPSNGTVSDNLNGTITYTPDAGYTGNDSFTYTIQDGQGGSDTAVVNITIGSVPPPTVSEPVLIDFENATLGAYTGQNGLDFAGITTVPTTALSGTQAGNSGSDGVFTIMASGEDFDLDALSTIVSSGRTKILIQAFDDGALVGSQQISVGTRKATDVTFDTSFDSVDQVVFTADSAFLIDDIALVTGSEGGSGPNTAPVATNDSATTDEDTAVMIDVLANDTDADATDVLVVSTFDSTSVEGAAVSLNPDGSFNYDPTSAAALQALASGESNIDTFSYTVSDGKGGTDTATVSVTVSGVNDAPVTNPMQIVLDFEGGLDSDGFVFSEAVITKSEPGVVSGIQAAASNADTLSVSYLESDSFDFEGGFFTLSGRGKVDLLVEGYLDGESVGSETLSLRAGKEVDVALSNVFDNVDEVVLTASGGVVVDDLTFFV